MLRHSARLATDLSVGVSPRRAHSAGFAGREQLRTSAKRASKGFIGLVVLALSGDKRLNGHLGWSRAMLL
ncbi:hypothetical protein Taro_045389 [Colocasia esculenta]|uniref:Uncharacterized protein n=1 Tax=Colocasia esculenta TaxID=4460 RepID=A0A843WWY0_COLES|nr:hypothetical protein [Colocasia esculenta]